jgi:hypothetical protein
MMPRSARAVVALALALGAFVAVPATAGAAPAVRVLPERVYALNAQRIALLHQRVRFHGVVATPAAGQVVRLRIVLGRRTVVRASRGVRPDGSFRLELKVNGTGLLRAYATVPGVGVARSRPVIVIVPSAGFGSSGPSVVFLQHRLRDLHYAVPLSGSFGDDTANAVMAYRKNGRLGREYGANRRVFERLAARRGAFHVRYPRDGKHVEADLGRQVLALINPGGRVYRVMVTSSGKPSTPTVLGSFHVYSQTPGFNVKGMLDSNYFIGGYAIHGYPDVPPFAASHGCLRIPLSQAAFVMGWLGFGDRVDVYR